MKRTTLRLLAALLVLLFLTSQSARPAYAASYTVNSLSDTIANDGACTLREAIQEANNGADTDCPGSPSSANDTITFSVSGPITLTATLPNIVSGQGTLTIDGSGQNVTISGNNAVRVMWVDSGANLTLQNLTITQASTPLSGGGVANSGTLTVRNSTFSNNTAGSGGGIVNLSSGTLTVSDSTFSNNTANTGGGIDNAGGTLTVINSTFSGNNATTLLAGGGIRNSGTLTVTNSVFLSNNSPSDGGGLWNNGTLTVTNSTFSVNSATGGDGGGIYNKSGSTLNVTDSAFSGNLAINNGGGIYNGGALNVTNSTFSANSTNNGGGGIYHNVGGTLTVTNSTFSGNSALPGNGGGIVTFGSATLRNTIIANSTSGGDCVGTLSGTNNNNLIKDTGANACGLTDGANGNIIGVDPNLGALTGSPAYFPLTASSPALNAGDNVTCAATDQRGVFRPQGGRCDIGAFEMVFVSLPLVVR